MLQFLDYKSKLFDLIFLFLQKVAAGWDPGAKELKKNKGSQLKKKPKPTVGTFV